MIYIGVEKSKRSHYCNRCNSLVGRNSILCRECVVKSKDNDLDLVLHNIKDIYCPIQIKMSDFYHETILKGDRDDIAHFLINNHLFKIREYEVVSAETKEKEILINVKERND